MFSMVLVATALTLAGAQEHRSMLRGFAGAAENGNKLELEK